MGSFSVETRGLTKKYKDVYALEGIDLAVPEGSVFGLVGPNGAGKTTLLRILSRLSYASSGKVRFFDGSCSEAEARRQIAYLPDVPGFYPQMSAVQTVALAAKLNKVPKREIRERTDAVLEMVGLTDTRKSVGGYSRGMKQRLGVAQALVGSPRLLMLDEPTSALDPIGRHELLDIISSLRGRTTIIFSTHILPDVERVCDHIALINKGHLVRQGSMAEFKAATTLRSVVLTVASEPSALDDRLRRQPWCESISFEGSGRMRIVVNDVVRAQFEIPVILGDLGYALVGFEGGGASLEEVFLSLVGGES